MPLGLLKLVIRLLQETFYAMLRLTRPLLVTKSRKKATSLRFYTSQVPRIFHLDPFSLFSLKMRRILPLSLTLPMTELHLLQPKLLSQQRRSQFNRRQLSLLLLLPSQINKLLILEIDLKLVLLHRRLLGKEVLILMESRELDQEEEFSRLMLMKPELPPLRRLLLLHQKSVHLLLMHQLVTSLTLRTPKSEK